MSKHYLFILHGMGNQGEGWSKPHADLIEKKAKKYSGETLADLRKRVEIVELEYGTLLKEVMDDLLEGGDSLGPANDWLKGGDDGSGAVAAFIRDSALDVTAYNYHSDTNIFVLNRIARRMLEVIQPHPIQNEFSLLCHSLGTKVGFDMLHMLYLEQGNSNGDFPDLDALSPLFKVLPNRDPHMLSPGFSNLYLIANVMPLLNASDLHTHWSGDTHVRIRRTSDPFNFQGGVIFDNYRIFNNHFDPIARVGRTHHIPARVYSDHVVLMQAHEWNMHSLQHYLAHPRVHVPIIEDLYGIELSAQKKQELTEKYLGDHRDLAKEASLEAALSICREFDGTDPKSLASYFKDLAALLPFG